MSKFLIGLVVAIVYASCIVGTYPSAELHARIVDAPLGSVLEGPFGARVFIAGSSSAGNWRWLHACNVAGLALSGEVEDIGGAYAWLVKRVAYPGAAEYLGASKSCPSRYEWD